MGENQETCLVLSRLVLDFGYILAPCVISSSLTSPYIVLSCFALPHTVMSWL